MDDSSKLEFDSIPVHALQAGSDDIHGMAKCLSPARNVSSTHQLVGVITPGLSADEPATTLPPVHDAQTMRSPNVSSTTVSPSAIPPVALDQLSDQAFDEDYRCRYFVTFGLFLTYKLQ